MNSLKKVYLIIFGFSLSIVISSFIFLFLSFLSSPPGKSGPEEYTSLELAQSFKEIKPGTFNTEISTFGHGAEAHKYTYKKDHYGRRVQPEIKNEKADNFLVLMGGSFTFGDELESKDTLAAKISKIQTQYRPYNYGLNAASPNWFLARFEEEDIASQLQEKQGLILYFFYYDQIPRSYGVLNQTGRVFGPRYALDDSGKLVRDGNHEHNWFQQKFLWTPFASRIITLLNNLLKMNVFMVFHTQKAIQHTCEVFKEMNELINKKFKNTSFAVANVHIGHMQLSNKNLLKCLIKNGIETWELEHPIAWEKEGMSTKFSNHPSAKSNELIAIFVAKKINPHKK